MNPFDEIRPLKVLALGPTKSFVDLIVAVHDDDEIAAEQCWHETVDHFLSVPPDIAQVPRKHRRAWAEDWAMWTMWAPAKSRLAWCTQCKRRRGRSR